MRIACLLGPEFEDSEFDDPARAFRDAGHDVVVIGTQRGLELKGEKGRVKVKTDKAIDEVKPADFDALFLPGGHSPDKLRADPRMVRFVQAFSDERPILAICHGPQLLLTAGMVRGRRMTAWRTIQVDIGYAGAEVDDDEVVVDRNLVTSRQPSDIPAFVKESLRLLEHRGPQPHA